MRRVKQAIYVLIGGFLLTATVLAAFNQGQGQGPQAAGYNGGLLVLGVLWVWLTWRAVTNAR